MFYLTLARLKKKKLLFLVPFLVMGVLVPALIMLIIYQNGGDIWLARTDIFRQLHVWIPMFAVWWTILVFQDFFEHEGNEILYLYHSPVQLLRDQCLVLVWYIMTIGFFWLLFYRFAGFGEIVLIQLVLESLFIGNFSYFLCFFLQNSGGTFLIVLAYCIYLNLFDSLNLFRFMSVFPEDVVVAQTDVRRMYMSAVLAVLFLMGGFVSSQLRHVYK